MLCTAEALRPQEKIFFNDSKALKKYSDKQRRENKRVPVIKMTPETPELKEDFAKASSDNLTPGPGLRRGPAKPGRSWHTGSLDDPGDQGSGDVAPSDQEEALVQVGLEMRKQDADQVATAGELNASSSAAE